MNIFRTFAKRLRKKQEFHYARISSYGICNAVFKVDYPVAQANTIPVNRLDTSLIGKRWIGKLIGLGEVSKAVPPVTVPG